MSAARPLDPWERQPYDSDESWSVFVEYRDQNPPRRGLQVFVKGRAVSPIKVATWMREHYWAERVAEYDRHLDGIRLREREAFLRQSAKEITAEHMRILAISRDVAYREIAKLQATVAESAGEVLRPRDLFALIESATKLDRLIRGESTENIQENGPDLSHLSEEELSALGSMLEKSEPITTH